VPPRPRLVGCLGLCSLIACAGPPAAQTAHPTPSPAPTTAPAAGPTAEPVHIETNSTGDKYITVVQRVVDAPGRNVRIAYRLRAASSQADIAGSSSVVTFASPRITFLDRHGKQLVADSPQAKITQQDKSVLMGGGVHARADDGSVLTCDSLRYDGRSERLHGYGHVVLSNPSGLTLTGRYLDGDVRLDNVRVSEQPL
jgi:hypothetical protein